MGLNMEYYVILHRRSASLPDMQCMPLDPPIHTVTLIEDLRLYLCPAFYITRLLVSLSAAASSTPIETSYC